MCSSGRIIGRIELRLIKACRVGGGGGVGVGGGGFCSHYFQTFATSLLYSLLLQGGGGGVPFSFRGGFGGGSGAGSSRLDQRDGCRETVAQGTRAQPKEVSRFRPR